MQFEMNLNVLACSSVQVDGNTYCSIFTAQAPMGDNAKNTLGSEVTKISAEPEVFHQLAAEGYKTGDSARPFKLIALLKKGPNGKSQPHILGVVPAAKTQKPAA